MARILVVDDDAVVRETFADILGSVGHEVLVARDGFEAVRVYREERPAVVILDIFMPGRDGIETLIELRAEWPDARIIAVSGGPRTQAVAPFDELGHARYLGADRALQKPVDLSALLAAVDEVLGTAKL